MRILVIEDDPHLREALKSCLESACFAVDTAKEGKEGSYLARTNDYDVIILDYNLPDTNGRAVCEEIRKSGRHSFILMLTVRTEIENKIDLLNLGADDYLTKPCSFDELVARIRALLRRPKMTQGEILQYKDIRLNANAQTVTRANKEIYLTRKEFMLLEYFMRNQGAVVSRTALAEHVWDAELDIFSNTIEAHILNLRRKIERKGVAKVIVTVPGRGYKIA